MLPISKQFYLIAMRNILFITIFSLICSCNTNHNQQQSITHEDEEEVENDVSKPLKLAVSSRIEAIYDIIFSEYKSGKWTNWPYTMFFDDNLKELWSHIPEEGPRLGFDPWTCSQDFDEKALKLMNVKVGDIVGNVSSGYRTEAVVTIKLSDDWEPNKIRLIMTSSKKEDGDFEWYIADFFDESYPEYKGVVAQIENEFSKEIYLDAMQKGLEEGKRLRNDEQ